MHSLHLMGAYMRHNWPRTSFNVLLFAVGAALVALVLGLGSQFEHNLSRNLHGIDMVVGAKGSPLQLVLSAVLQADVPTGNISLKDAEALQANPMIRSAVPVALGDNIASYRIVGTTPDYAALYHGELAEGRMFKASMEAVLGADVAAKLGLQVGQKFVGSHGLTPGGEVHEFAPYSVVGILKPSGTVMDRLVLTPVDSVWYVHENDTDTPVEARPKAENREVTALLVKFASPLAVVSLPRFINKNTTMQAASPAFEAMRLRKVLGVGSAAITAVGFVIVALSGLSLLITSAEAVRQRLYDIALMRCFGASPSKVLRLVVMEGLVISLTGALLGVMLAEIGMRAAAGRVLDGQLSVAQGLPLGLYAGVVGGTVLLGVVGSLLPALRIYRMSLPKLLAGK